MIQLPCDPGKKMCGRACRGFSVLSALLGALWLSAVITGTFLMLRYSETPGQPSTPPVSWPDSTAILRDPARPVLVMFVHPHCPCSRASIGELERLVARCPGRFSAHVLFLRPAGMTEEWVKTDLWQRSVSIPGVSVRCDDGGSEAERFHSATSGQTVLYDRDGKLLFGGGITIARGHSGDNAGSAAVAAFLEHEIFTPVKTPAFGCSLCETECLQTEGSCTP